jgi:hypothetical protein
MQTRFQPALQFRQMFRTGVINGAQRIKSAPMSLTVAETSQVAIRIAFFRLLPPKYICEGQSGVRRA